MPPPSTPTLDTPEEQEAGGNPYAMPALTFSDDEWLRAVNDGVTPVLGSEAGSVLGMHQHRLGSASAVMAAAAVVTPVVASSTAVTVGGKVPPEPSLVLQSKPVASSTAVTVGGKVPPSPSPASPSPSLTSPVVKRMKRSPSPLSDVERKMKRKRAASPSRASKAEKRKLMKKQAERAPVSTIHYYSFFFVLLLLLTIYTYVHHKTLVARECIIFRSGKSAVMPQLGVRKN